MYRSVDNITWFEKAEVETRARVMMKSSARASVFRRTRQAVSETIQNDTSNVSVVLILCPQTVGGNWPYNFIIEP